MTTKNAIAIILLMLCCVQVQAQENSEYEQAYQAYESGDIDESYIFLKNSLKNKPNHLPSKILMGEVLALSGIFGDARLVFEEALDDGADANLIVESYVRILLITKQYDTILDLEFEQLTDNKLGFLTSAKAAAIGFQGNIEQASVYHDEAVSLAPNNISVINSAATFYLQQTDDIKANKLIQTSFALNPSVAETFMLLAVYLERNGSTQDRLKALEEGLALSPNHPILLRDLVTVYAKQGEYNKAKDMLNKTLQLSPNDPMAKLLLSWIASQLNDDQLAKNTLDELVSNLSLLDSERIGENTGLLMISALANLAANNLELARGQLKQYISKQPTSFKAVSLLVDVYKKERNYVGAANLLEKYSSIVEQDMSLVADLCSLYIKAAQNFKCNSLLDRTKYKFAESDLYIQTESNLLSARGKLSLALANLDRIKEKGLGTTAQKALIAIQGNEYAAAQGHIDELLKTDSINPDFINLQASLFKKQNRFEEAQNLYRQALEIEPQHFSANFNLAALLYSTRQTGEANRITEKLMLERPGDSNLLVLRGRILIDSEDYEKAFEVLSRATAIKRNNTDAIEALALLYIETKEYQNALLKVNELIKSDTTSAKYLKMRSSLNYQLGNSKEAIQDLRVLFGIIASQPYELYMLSIDQSVISDHDGALRTLQQALKYEPNDFFLHRDLAKTALILNNIELAKSSVNFLKETKPNNADVLMLQADLFLIEQNLPQASKHYIRSVQQANRLVPSLIGSYKLANIGIGEDEFVNTFERLALAPGVNVFAVHLLADYYFNNKKWAKAKERYISISSAVGYSALPMALNNLALIYVSEGKFDAAYNFAQQSHELLPSNPDILDTLGWISTLRGQYDEGLDLLRKSYSMNAQNADLRYHIAYTLFKLDRVSESKRELKVLLEDFPSFDKRTEAESLQKTLNAS